MLTRIPQKGERIKFIESGKVHTVVEVKDTIVFFDDYLEQSKEYNCFIAKFADGQYNNLVEHFSTVCLACQDDYDDIAEECFIAGVCPDCKDSYTSEELLEVVMENQNG